MVAKHEFRSIEGIDLEDGENVHVQFRLSCCIIWIKWLVKHLLGDNAAHV